MILSDQDIYDRVTLGAIGIEPFDFKYIQPASYDLHLSSHVAGVRPNWTEFGDSMIDLAEKQSVFPFNMTQSMVIDSGAFVLGSTVERVRIPHNLAARVEGKSSLGRVGLCVHVTAGFIDPGFSGHITLEIVNHSPHAIRVYAGMPIAQLSFEMLSSPSMNPYGKVAGSKYQDQGEKPVASQFWANFPDKILEV